jgi:hypothetical protein
MSDIFGEGQETNVLAADLSAKAAIEMIGEIESPAALNAFLEGEGRITVMKVAVERFPTNAEVDPSPSLMPDTEDGGSMPDPIVDHDLSGKDVGKEGKRDASAEKRFLIEIDEVEGRPNFEVVGVNGTIYKIKRGEPVEVPESVLEVLNNAVAERLVQTESGVGGIVTSRRKYSSVPFRMLRVL